MAYAEKLRRLRADINAAVDLENRLGGKPQQPKSAADPTPLPELLTRSVDACRAERKRNVGQWGLRSSSLRSTPHPGGFVSYGTVLQGGPVCTC